MSKRQFILCCLIVAAVVLVIGPIGVLTYFGRRAEAEANLKAEREKAEAAIRLEQEKQAATLLLQQEKTKRSDQRWENFDKSLQRLPFTRKD